MKRRPHRLDGRMRWGRRSTTTLPWPVCVNCGLVILKNAATAKAAAKPCEGDREDDL